MKGFAQMLVLLAGGGLVAGAAPAAPLLLVNNGLAPPEPANVIDGSIAVAGSPTEDVAVVVRNAGCEDPVAPCPLAGAPTTVGVVTGAHVVGIVDVRDASRLEASGGLMVGLVRLRESASLSVDAAADLPIVQGFDAASLTVADGTVATVTLEGDAALAVAGGVFTDSIQAREAASVVYGGGWSNSLSGEGGASILLEGGTVNALAAAGDASIRVTDGAVTGGILVSDAARILIEGATDLGTLLRARDAATIRIAGTDFAVDGSPVGPGALGALSGTLTGTLASGDPFSVAFQHAGYDDGTGLGPYTGSIVLVPEPAPGLLLAAGLALLAAHGRRRHPLRSPREPVATPARVRHRAGAARARRRPRRW